jgi:hypothetical protein
MLFRVGIVVLWLTISGDALCDELNPEGSFINRSGDNVAAAMLRFTEAAWKKGRDQGFALALQRRTDYLYLWARTPSGGGLGARPLCDGHLADAAGNRVNVDDLRSFAIADFEGNGSTYLVALMSDGARLLTWKLDACEGKSIFQSVGNPQPIPTGASPSGYQRLVTGDFSDRGADGVELLSEGPAQISEWSFSAGKFEFMRSDRLMISADVKKPVTEIRYVTTTTRLNHGSPNVAHETATVVLHDRGYTLYRNGTPIDYAPVCRDAPTNCAHRILLFNLDQGFSGGLQDLARKDHTQATDVLNRIIGALRNVPSTFKVWALINPIQQDRATTVALLDELAKAGIPFVLDYYSSDITNLAAVKRSWLDYSPRAFDPIKGVSLDLEGSITEPDNLNFFARRYGKNFVGVRLMERLGMDIQANDATFPQILSNQALAKQELSFDWNLVTRLLNWSKKNARYVVWADPALYIPYECYWTTDQVARAVARRDLYVSKQREFARQTPNLIPMYDNNEGLKRCGVASSKYQMTPRNFRLRDWEKIPQSIAAEKTGPDLLTGRDGFGISVQSWTTDSDPLLSAGTLPPEEMAIWILDALQKRAGMVELEPYFYFFYWPKDIALPQSRPILPGKKIGDPRDTLTKVLRDVVGG